MPVPVYDSLFTLPTTAATEPVDNPAGPAYLYCAVGIADWPLAVSAQAARVPLTEPLALLSAGRISAATSTARDMGVHPAQRKRAALACCPHLLILDSHPHNESTLFEDVALSLSQAVPHLEIVEPGLCLFPAASPIHFYGSITNCEHQVRDAIQRRLTGIFSPHDPPPVFIAFSTQRMTALLAAAPRHHSELWAHQIGPRSVALPPDKHEPFLDAIPIDVLKLPAITDIAGPLGISSLGQFARLPASAVETRFGTAAVAVWREFNGHCQHPLSRHRFTQRPHVERVLDAPVEQVDAVAFIVRGIASELLELLTSRGVACTHMEIELETEHAEISSRIWHAPFTFDTQAIVDRSRWQLTSWLSGPEPDRPTAGVYRISLTASEWITGDDLQSTVSGQMSDADRRAIRGLDRVNEILPNVRITRTELRGGRGPRARFELVDWTQQSSSPALTDVHRGFPWPGGLPDPAPPVVFTNAVPVQVRGSTAAVTVSVRATLSEEPLFLQHSLLQHSTNAVYRITRWNGPWLFDERWWDSDRAERLCRFQFVTDEPRAYLCCFAQTRWWIEAIYD